MTCDYCGSGVRAYVRCESCGAPPKPVTLPRLAVYDGYNWGWSRAVIDVEITAFGDTERRFMRPDGSIYSQPFMQPMRGFM